MVENLPDLAIAGIVNDLFNLFFIDKDLSTAGEFLFLLITLPVAAVALGMTLLLIYAFF